MEYLWSHLKQNDLANFAPKNLTELERKAHHAVDKLLPRRTQYLRAFWIQTELNLNYANSI